jgi:hypothetical protein
MAREKKNNVIKMNKNVHKKHAKNCKKSTKNNQAIDVNLK